MRKEDMAILYLSVSLLVIQLLWVRAERRAAYLEGRIALEQEFANQDDDGICLADIPPHPGDCNSSRKDHKAGKKQ